MCPSPIRRYRSAWEPAPRRAPPGTVLFAIGDVHGCSAQLDALLELLAPAIAVARGAGLRAELVLLGDYIDRGPDSLGVLRRLAGLDAAPDVPVRLLRGNHDQLLIDMLAPQPEPATLNAWLGLGGGTVLAELGIETAGNSGASAIAAALQDRLDPAAVRLVQGLRHSWQAGDYLFVHAGIDPALPLGAQRDKDLLTIRRPFLEAATWPHAFAVVHGHTPCGPLVRPFRIAVDSRCYDNGVLTAVELADDRLRFHAVRGPAGKAGAADPLAPAEGRVFAEVGPGD